MIAWHQISKSALWNAWKAVRKQLRLASVRDVTDFIEYDIDPEVWIQRVLRDLAQETFDPSKPTRFHIAKSAGFSRRMTLPAIPDLVLYRAIVDTIYKKARRREAKHVYFERQDFARRQAKEVDLPPDEYAAGGSGRFEAWLRYHQYRKHIVLKRVYPYILITDIANYFDSILYTRVSDALLGLSVPPRLVGLLFFLLERLSYRDSYTESPRIGLPVDEFDCSRKLAHMVLFPHDRAVIKAVGEDAYVRWMDDQNVGVESRGDGLRAVAVIADSLARLHLTPNAGKTKLLTLSEARRHFHLPANDDFDRLEPLPTATRRERALLRARLLPAWRRALRNEGHGEWGKILKRVYRLAALANARFLRLRAAADVLEYPTLTRRIADYMRVTGSGTEYLTWAEGLWGNDEQPYGYVNLLLFEAMLRVEPEPPVRANVRRRAAGLLDGRWRPTGWAECVAVAPLVLLRFGDGRSLPRLLSAVKGSRTLPDPALKAAAIVFASAGLREFRVVRRLAARLLRNPLADVVRFVEGLEAIGKVPDRFKARLDVRYDPVTRQSFVDMRAIVVARLLSINRKAPVVKWLKERKRHLMEKSSAKADRLLVARLVTTA